MRRSNILIIAAFALLILLLILCVFRTVREPANEITCATTTADPARGETYPLPVGPHVPGELIITGQASDIDYVLSQIPQLAETETVGPCESLELGEQLQFREDSAWGQTQTPSDRLVTRLYPLPDRMDPWDATLLIYQEILRAIEERDNEPLIVFADPNYLMGYDIDGDPSNGHSGIAGAAPAPLFRVTGQRIGDDALEEAFWGQWAFGSPDRGGIELVRANDVEQAQISVRTVPEMGNSETMVAIFDTSPYGAAGLKTVAHIEPPLDLNVLTPVAVPENVPPSLDGDPTMKEHGLFAAGLAHALAPDSEKVLIRVLNDTAQGDLYSLLNAMAQFTDMRQNSQGSLNNTIFNLSLGINPNQKRLDANTEVLAIMQMLIDSGVPEYVALLDDKSLDNQLVPIPALHKSFLDLDALGIVVVAAAGNDGNTGVMQMPAGYPEVIGVAANMSDGEAPCYSNLGQLAAPGGGIGGTETWADCETETKQVTSTCFRNTDVKELDCSEAVISLVTESKSHNSNTYAYWIGTSFSTPMVSGLSALILDKFGALEPAGVNAALHCSASGSASLLPDATPGLTLGVGRINVPAALSAGCFSP